MLWRVGSTIEILTRLKITGLNLKDALSLTAGKAKERYI